MTNRRYVTMASFIALLAVEAACQAAAPTTAPTTAPRRRPTTAPGSRRPPPPEPPVYPGENVEPIVYQWRELPKDVSGIYMSGPMVHSNGRVYIPLCNYKGPNVMVEFDPRTEAMRVASRLTSNSVLGRAVASTQSADAVPPGPEGYTLDEDEPGVARSKPWEHHQIKIHSPLWEGRDGKVYFTTHTGLEFPGLMRTYPGGHFVSYDPKTGKTEDLGIARRHEGILSCVLDRQRGTLYGVTWPSAFFVRCRIDEPDPDRRLSMLGLTATFLDSCPRSFAVLANGRVYLPDAGTGEICVWDPDSGRLLRGLGLDTPADGAAPSSQPAELRDSRRFRNWWMSGVVSPDGMHYYFGSQRSSHLIEIDGTQGKWGAVIDHGRMTPWLPKEAYNAWAPPRPSPGWFSADGRRLYCRVRIGRGRTHVMSVDLAGGEIRDYGLVKPDYDAKPPAEGQAQPPERWYQCVSNRGRPGIIFVDVEKFPAGKVVGRLGSPVVHRSFADGN